MKGEQSMSSGGCWP